MKTLFAFLLITGTATAADRKVGGTSGNYPFGYRSPYQGGYDGYGTYYGRSNQGQNMPDYAPYGLPSRRHPSYQPYLNPYYPVTPMPRWMPNPYYFPR